MRLGLPAAWRLQQAAGAGRRCTVAARRSLAANGTSRPSGACTGRKRATSAIAGPARAPRRSHGCG